MTSRTLALALAVAFPLGTCGFGVPSVARADQPADAKPATDAGTVTGTVSAIDYRANTMTVDAKGRKIAVTILPSTSIQGPGSGFHSVTEIKRGKTVTVLLSERAGTYSAQLITLH